MYEEKINAYDAPERRAELVEAISRLVRIRSVREEPLPGMPFGPGPAAALAEGLKLAEELGFATRNYDNYVGTADLNDKETALHILCHLDVVGEGTGWTVTEPYAPKEVDGMLYGRGTDDDKGPVAAVLLAMKAVKELGVPLRRNARLLMGTDEESGSSDIAYYYAREPYAPYAFSPDAEFPLINIEKGSYKPVFTKSWPAETATPRVTEFRGGFRINVLRRRPSAWWPACPPTPPVPIATGPPPRPACATSCARRGTACTSSAAAKAHASLPEEGVNAITGLLHLLCSSPGQGGLHRLPPRAQRPLPHGDCAGKAWASPSPMSCPGR